MKITAKIFVGIIAIALIVSCLAFTATADFTESNIEDILEYYTCENYASIDYEDLPVGKYTAHHTATEGDGFSYSFNRIDGDNTNNYTVVDENGNKMLKISDPAPLGVRYEFNFEGDDLTELVTSVRYMTTAEEGKAGSTFSLFLYAHDDNNPLYPNPRLRTVSILCDENDPAENRVEYLSVVDGAYYEDNVLEGFVPTLNTWYTIEAVYNLPLDTYTVTITPDGGEAVSVSGNLGTLAYIDTVRTEVKCSKGNTDNDTYIDELEIYEGTFVRDNKNVDAITAETLLSLEDLASDTESAYVKARIAKVLKYVVMDGAYLPGSDVADRDAVLSAIDWAKGYIYPTYLESMIACVADIDTEANYYERNDYALFLKSLSDEIPTTAEGILALPGVTSADTTAVLNAKAATEIELTAVNKVKSDSEAFIAAMLSYDSTSKDYNYIEALYKTLADCTYRAPEYKYVPVNAREEIIYATVADAEVEFNKFSEKRNSVYNNVQNFFNGISIMETTAYEDFATLYNGYVLAHTVYVDGVIDVNLDESTCEGLTEAIAKYPALTNAVEVRIAPCDKFIELVNKAEIAMYHSMKKAYITEAYPYYDDTNTEKIIEASYPGITEAKAKFDTIRAFLESNYESAQAYIEAVALLESATGFAAKKAAVEAALLLKANGDIVGIDGVAEANMALAAVESYVAAAEGASETLIAIVSELSEAKTLEKRRELINSANAFLSLAEDSISGVTSAKASLTSLIAAYNEEVRALNSAFSSAITNALSAGV